MRQKIKITPQKLRKFYYREHVSARAAAEYFGCSPTTIRNYLHKYNFRVKRTSESLRGRVLSEEHRGKVIPYLNNFKGGKVHIYEKDA